MQIVYDYPSWFLILCVLGGLLAGGALYLRDRLNRHFGNGLRFFLFAIRAIAMSVLAFFLLKPLIKTTERTVEKPIIVIAQDNSESLAVNQDSTTLAQYMNELGALKTALENDFEVKTLSFGEKVEEGWEEVDFSGQTTNFSDLMDEVYNRYSNRNLGAVVVASDGIYNTGLNPQYSSRRLEAPVYAVALGDTTPQKDILIADASHNRMAYLGNRFPVEIRIDANGMQGLQSTLKVSRKGETVHSEVISFDQDQFSVVVPVLLDAEEAGLQKYSLSISSKDGEITTANNQRSIFIDVLDGRQKVLILAANPHPDVAALKLAVNRNDLYDAESVLLKDFEGKVDEFNLVVLHQVPDFSDRSRDILDQLAQKEVPTLFILGGQTNFNQFNELNTGVEVKGFGGTMNEMNTSFKEGFSLFLIDDELRQLVKKFPPMHIPFGDLKYSPGLNTMLQQRAGILDTGDPLVAFNSNNDRKIGVVLGEGLWRWRMFSFLEKQQHDPFDKFVSKIVQYLASQDDKSRFRVEGNSDWLENDEVYFEAEVYNESYELIQDVSVDMEIKDEEGKSYDYQFSVSGERYRLNAGSLPTGNYTYKAKSTVAGEVLAENGEFSVSEIHLEQVKTQADHRMLFNFADASGGSMITQGEMGNLPTMIINSGKTQSVSHEAKILSDFINTKWILFLIIGLLSIEWLLRKRNGTY